MRQGIICVRQDDSNHMRALLGRYASWGMLRYYDMDAVFEGIEELTMRLFMVFFDETMSWAGFIEHLHELSVLENDPMRHPEAFTLCMFDESKGPIATFSLFALSMAEKRLAGIVNGSP